MLGKATSFEPTQSVVTKPSVMSPSSASITLSAGLRPRRKPAARDVDGQDVRQQDSSEAADLASVVGWVVRPTEPGGRVVEAERGLQRVDDLGCPACDII